MSLVVVVLCHWLLLCGVFGCCCVVSLVVVMWRRWLLCGVVSSCYVAWLVVVVVWCR